MPSTRDTTHFVPYHILLYFHNWLHRGHPYCVISITAMSDSLPSTSHSQKIQLTISEFTPIVTLECPLYKVSKHIKTNRWYSCVNLHRDQLSSSRLYLLKYSRMEKAQDVSLRLLSLSPFPNFHHVRHLHTQPHITVIVQLMCHFFGSICQSFFHFLLVAWVILHPCQLLFICAHINRNTCATFLEIPCLNIREDSRAHADPVHTSVYVSMHPCI